MNTTKVSVTAEVEASPEKVWKAWTSPEHIVKWNFASPDWHCPSSTNDLRVGGKMKSRMEAKDGSFGFDFEATYDEVVELRKISYSMDDGRQATTLFESAGNKTRITTIFDAEGTHPIEMQKDGWQAILNNFKNHAEKIS